MANKKTTGVPGRRVRRALFCCHPLLRHVLDLFHSHRFGPFAGTIFVGLLIGCGDGRPARVPVSGQVRIDGEPLAGGYVRFVPKNDRASSGTIGSDGRFTLGCFDDVDGAVIGTHRVAVIANVAIDESTMKWLAPEKYADYATSGIEVDIEGPTGDLLIELTTGGGDQE